MPKKRGPYLGEAGRLTLQLTTERRQRQVTMDVAIDWLKEASDAEVVRKFFLPAFRALKRNYGIRPSAKPKRPQA